MERLARLFGYALASGVVVFACTVNLPDTNIYSCSSDSDCGGDGFKCTAKPGGVGACCKPTGAEVCNGLDDDCNGLIDDGFPAESCNGKDDNCNGKVDEGFDLQNDPLNCGTCGRACNGDQYCFQGGCQTRGELLCNDGIDNDGDGKIDCADPDCNLQRCGDWCVCKALKKTEQNCTDGVDNDGDGKIDCADEDCAGAGCGDGGCNCFNGKPTETDCKNGLDDDGDMLVDCADSDCDGQRCQSGMSTFTCASGACACNDGGVVAETGVNCRDRIDNDCNGLYDCEEPACDMLSCSPDGGPGCFCVGGTAKETDCADRKDNDNDGTTDCMDSLPDGGGDCPIGTACTYLNAGGQVKNGSCAADHLCK